MTTATRGRAIILRRSQGRCELCGRVGTNVHHRMRQGRPWNPANLLRVCGSGNASGCHGWIETHPGHAGELGLIVPRGHDPAPVALFCRPVLFGLGWWFPDDDGIWRTPRDRMPILTPAIRDAIAALHSHLDAMADAL